MPGQKAECISKLAVTYIAYFGREGGHRQANWHADGVIVCHCRIKKVRITRRSAEGPHVKA